MAVMMEDLLLIICRLMSDFQMVHIMKLIFKLKLEMLRSMEELMFKVQLNLSIKPGKWMVTIKLLVDIIQVLLVD